MGTVVRYRARNLSVRVTILRTHSLLRNPRGSHRRQSCRGVRHSIPRFQRRMTSNRRQSCRGVRHSIPRFQRRMTSKSWKRVPDPVTSRHPVSGFWRKIVTLTPIYRARVTILRFTDIHPVATGLLGIGVGIRRGEKGRKGAQSPCIRSLRPSGLSELS